MDTDAGKLKVNWKLLRCGYREGWRKSVGWIRQLRKDIKHNMMSQFTNTNKWIKCYGTTDYWRKDVGEGQEEEGYS